MMISRGNRDSLRQCLSRAFRHSDMKDVCKTFASNQAPKKLSPAFDGLPLQPQLVSIARALVDLQEARHQADYNAYRTVKRQEALHHVQLANKALGADPILTMEISNLPEIVRVYTTLCR